MLGQCTYSEPLYSLRAATRLPESAHVALTRRIEDGAG